MKVFINTDGAVGPPNPGPAGAGYVILFHGEDGPDSVVGAVPLGECNHHEAEYHAAIHALRRARELGATEAVLRSDSLVLVDQMNEEAEVRSPEIVRLAQQLRTEMARYEEVEIVWIRRRENKTADLLSRIGLAKAEPLVEGPESEPEPMLTPAPVLDRPAGELLEQTLAAAVGDEPLLGGPGPEPEALPAG